MLRLSPLRKLLRRVHPEGIPWPGSFFYNVVSASKVFQNLYDSVTEDILRYRPQGSLLDIGTGPGWLLIKLCRKSPGLRLTGVDVSSSMVEIAGKNVAKAGFSKEIEVKVGSVSHLPFPGESFDMVVSTGSLHHWKEPVGGLNEIYRVLKPGSYALLYDVVKDIPHSLLKKVAREFGMWRVVLSWFHGFEEPFWGQEGLASLARASLFQESQGIHFVSLLCCLVLRRA